MTYPAAVAVYDAEARQWASLAPRVDIASQGDTADEAIGNVLAAVREAEEVCAEAQLSMGGPVSWADFAEFVRFGAGSMVVRVDLVGGPPAT